ncbi:ABC transporter substrate-binding protein [Goodfellowiella coeruleoviolacea]|uniref:Multiple sugar transport system substrate-binding protein n=1 Tax=Goodfellowiella coeruleoviolacea TaxID=334858 RepID=A0AAE3KND2_9PSEU|nr:ABC transporter substrate-binding protein [Goodfellowiella coeruleoviolacea]MCP2168563.1 multiple sugar transport system substrate-binding protein [Goodfellowiella coeruleoviolacea]
MERSARNARPGRPLTRRSVLGLGLGAAAAPLLSACAGLSTTSGAGKDGVGFLSTQFTPLDERQRFEQILKNTVTDINVGYNPVDVGVFGTTLTSQVNSGRVSVSLVGALHGELGQYTDLLSDLDDLVAELGDRGFPSHLLSLTTLGGKSSKYVPWMQASSVLAVHKKALGWLPAGADVRHLTYDQLLDWVSAGRAANGGKPIFGLPAGPKGLYHRFFQGYLLPSFTGGQITTFRNQDAVAAWEYMKRLWANTAPASTNYDYMQEPLARGEVLIAWDHVARLVKAPESSPDDWLMVPAPRGPKGQGYLLVAAGLAIPRGAPQPDRARAVIRALTTATAQAEVLRQNAFFPVIRDAIPADLPPAARLEADAISNQSEADGAVLSLPPGGLGKRDGEVSQIFKNCFTEICLDGKPVQEVLDAQAVQLNAILDQVKVPCWAPDPVEGTSCRVL